MNAHPFRWLLTAGVVFAASIAWAGQSSEEGLDSGTEKAPASSAMAKSTDTKFIRVRYHSDGGPIALETSITRYLSENSESEGLTVDLIGAVHIADRRYYDELNEVFESYDVLLYELVAPEGREVPDGAAQGRRRSPLGAVQNGLGSILELDFQLDHVDYSKENFVHADMSPEEFSKSMENRGESMMKMLFRMLGNNAVMQAKASVQPGSGDLLLALFAPDRALRLKRIMAAQFEDLDIALAGISGREGSTIITERNKEAIAELERQIAAGKKRIGIFYGAAHLPDMEQRLLRDFEMTRGEVRWLSAWSLQTEVDPSGN